MAHRVVQDLGKGETFTPPPRATALGSLLHYITHADPSHYQPANISFDLLPPLEDIPKRLMRNRRARREKQCERALVDLQGWLGSTPCSSIVVPPATGSSATDDRQRTTDSIHG